MLAGIRTPVKQASRLMGQACNINLSAFSRQEIFCLVTAHAVDTVWMPGSYSRHPDMVMSLSSVSICVNLWAKSY